MRAERENIHFAAERAEEPKSENPYLVIWSKMLLRVCARARISSRQLLLVVDRVEFSHKSATFSLRFDFCVWNDLYMRFDVIHIRSSDAERSSN